MPTLTLNPIADNNLYSGTPTTNYGSGELAISDGATRLRRSIIKFDLSGIPPAAIIRSAKLRLYVFNVEASTSLTATIHRILRDWSESESSWNNAKTAVPWGTAGCANTSTDRSATEAGSASISGVGWVEIDIDLSELSSMISDNNGFLLRRSAGYTGYKEIRSSDGAATNKPELVIEYFLPTQAAEWWS